MKKKSLYKMILLVVISLIYAIPISYSQNKAKIEKIEDVDFYNFSYPHKVIFNDKRVSTIEVQKGKFDSAPKVMLGVEKESGKVKIIYRK